MDSILAYIVDLKKEIEGVLSKYKLEKERNISLNSKNREMLDQIHDLENEVKELKKRVEVVDIANGMSVKGNDSVGFARERVNVLIRQIDKCISLLNE